MWFKLILLLVSHSCFINAKEWWQGANFYQIYPKSFMDSDDDGYGDLQGIRSKIPYLKDLGIDGVWLSPIYTSPQKDGGYDITNYTEIDPMFGTMNDFDQLIKTVKENGMHLILDYVPNVNQANF
uniref:CSON015622 protein n=1 Tax=Culicoides sonorensis TaxID=179676 RepID=A0A336K7Y7_CULSO